MTSLTLALLVLASPTPTALAAGVPESMVSPTPEGYRLAEVQPGSLYERLGLRPGDLLTEVNHHPMRTEADLRWVSAEAKKASKITVKVLRDGKPQVFHYRIPPRKE